MAIHINLLQNQKDYTRLENLFHIARVGIVILGVVCLVALVVLFGLRRNAQNSLDQATIQKNNLQIELNELQDEEARIILINEKMESMQEILRDVPDYSRQIETLLAYTPVSTQSGAVQRITQDSSETMMSILFPGVLELTQFIALIESADFQKNFKGIEIDSIKLEDFSNELLLTINVTHN